VPFAAGRPESTHTDVPVAQLVLPVWQGSAGVQAASATQPTHVPALQTWSVPQEVPSESGVPESTQVEVPVAQLVAPVWQGFAGVQATPAVQAAQVPPLQTAFVPQLVPLATLPVSAQTGVPEAQSTTATRQGLAVAQGWPHAEERKSQVPVTVPRAPQSMT
jgi:hypothetical protein